MTDLQAESGFKIQPIAGNVFLKRRANRESKLNGLHISQGASVGSCDAEIVAIDGSFPYAEAGDIVHVPHYGVIDMEYDGTEYATCKADRLFVVRRDGRWTPINKYVRVRKCENDHIRDESGEIALYMTDNHIETTNWVEIVDIASDCEAMRREYIGMYTPLEESDERLARIERTSDYCIAEDLIKFVTDGE